MLIADKQARIVDEAKTIEKDALYSAKGHYEEANYWTRFHFFLGVPAALFSAIAGASALAQFDNHTLIAGFLAIFVSALTGITTFLNPNGKASAHQAIGTKYTALRHRTRTFYNLTLLTDVSEQELLEQLQSLAKQCDDLNEASLPISDRAYKIARKKIAQKQQPHLLTTLPDSTPEKVLPFPATTKEA
jgi:hypothetical protein